MRIAIIIIAGVSSRFNEGIPENDRRHKAIYYEKDPKNSLLYHLVTKCTEVDRIVLVCGYLEDEIKDYCDSIFGEFRRKIDLIFNPHYEDLASGYSLYLGLEHTFSTYKDVREIIFFEGDLDFEQNSFKEVLDSPVNVLTYNYEPIVSKKAVVLYRNGDNHYKYAFNSSHGLLKIEDVFSAIYNSAQIWKFVNAERLKEANDWFLDNNKSGTNLSIIQGYIDLCSGDRFELIGIREWTNCNTREDYRRILKRWENEE